MDPRVESKLDLRKTSHSSDDTSTSSEDIFSGEGDPVGLSTTEKWIMDDDNVSEGAGILRKSSTVFVRPNGHYNYLYLSTLFHWNIYSNVCCQLHLLSIKQTGPVVRSTPNIFYRLR